MLQCVTATTSRSSQPTPGRRAWQVLSPRTLPAAVRRRTSAAKRYRISILALIKPLGALVWPSATHKLLIRLSCQCVAITWNTPHTRRTVRPNSRSTSPIRRVIKSATMANHTSMPNSSSTSSPRALPAKAATISTFSKCLSKEAAETFKTVNECVRVSLSPSHRPCSASAKSSNKMELLTKITPEATNRR